LLNVLAPASVWDPVVTTPPNDPFAGCKFKACPVKVAPLAFGAAPIAESVTSPVLVPETLEAEIVPENVLLPPIV